MAAATSTMAPSWRASMRPPATAFSTAQHGRSPDLPRARHHSYLIDGKPKRSRTRRSNAACRALANVSGSMRPRNGASSRSASATSRSRSAPTTAAAAALRQIADRANRARAPAPRVHRRGRAWHPACIASRRRTIAIEGVASANPACVLPRTLVKRASTRSRCARQRRSAPPWRDVLVARCLQLHARDADGAAPVVERIAHVGVTELDAHRTAARAFAIVPLEVAIDAGEGHLERNALARPAGHLLERRADDADQVAVVLATEVRFDLAAVVFRRNH